MSESPAPSKASLDEKSPLPSGQALPPVQPPNASFILQLFLIPMMIVMIIVSLWLAVNWLTQVGTDPGKLVDELQQPNDGSWQRAFTLANMLRNPEYEYLRDDDELAGRLGKVLENLLVEASPNKDRVQLRIFVCRALGEFRTPVVFPPLLEGCTTEKNIEDLSVQRAALEALAIAVGGLPTTDEAARADLSEPIIELSRSSTGDETDGASTRDEVRATTAFTLGVLGDPAALARLVVMLDDPFPNARYNAATGLARAGDPRAIPVLVEMLDPENPQVVQDVIEPDEQSRKRLEVMTNAIRSVERLMLTQPLAEMPALQEALQSLSQSKMPSDLRLAAKELLLQ